MWRRLLLQYIFKGCQVLIYCVTIRRSLHPFLNSLRFASVLPNVRLFCEEHGETRQQSAHYRHAKYQQCPAPLYVVFEFLLNIPPAICGTPFPIFIWHDLVWLFVSKQDGANFRHTAFQALLVSAVMWESEGEKVGVDYVGGRHVHLFSNAYILEHRLPVNAMNDRPVSEIRSAVGTFSQVSS